MIGLCKLGILGECDFTCNSWKSSASRLNIIFNKTVPAYNSTPHHFQTLIPPSPSILKKSISAKIYRLHSSPTGSERPAKTVVPYPTPQPPPRRKKKSFSHRCSHFFPRLHSNARAARRGRDTIIRERRPALLIYSLLLVHHPQPTLRSIHSRRHTFPPRFSLARRGREKPPPYSIGAL